MEKVYTNLMFTGTILEDNHIVDYVNTPNIFNVARLVLNNLDTFNSNEKWFKEDIKGLKKAIVNSDEDTVDLLLDEISQNYSNKFTYSI